MAGGQYLFAGLSGAGNSLARGLDVRELLANRAEEEQKERAQRVTKLTAALDTMGILPKDVGVTRSLEELEGFTEGIQGRIKLAEAMQREAAARAEAESNAATEALLLQAGQLPPGVQGPAAPMTIQNLLANLPQNPAAIRNPAIQKLLLEQAQQAQAGEAALPFGREDVVDLEKLTGDPRLSGQFQVRQSRGSFQNLNTQPRATGGLPFEERVALMDRADLQKRRQAITKQLGEFVPPDQVPLLTAELQQINARLQGDAPARSASGATSAAPYPEGTPLRGKDGKLYVVRNGKPELAE